MSIPGAKHLTHSYACSKAFPTPTRIFLNARLIKVRDSSFKSSNEQMIGQSPCKLTVAGDAFTLRECYSLLGRQLVKRGIPISTFSNSARSCTSQSKRCANVLQCRRPESETSLAKEPLNASFHSLSLRILTLSEKRINRRVGGNLNCRRC